MAHRLAALPRRGPSRAHPHPHPSPPAAQSRRLTVLSPSEVDAALGKAFTAAHHHHPAAARGPPAPAGEALEDGFAGLQWPHLVEDHNRARLGTGAPLLKAEDHPSLSSLGVQDAAPRVAVVGDKARLTDQVVARSLRRFLPRARNVPMKSSDARLLRLEFEATYRTLLRDSPLLGRHTLRAMMSFYAVLGLTHHAEALMAQAERHGIPLTIIVWSALMVAYKNAKNSDGLLHVVQRMGRCTPPVQLDQYTYCTVMAALPDVKLRLRLLEQMLDSGISATVFHLNALISGASGAASGFDANCRVVKQVAERIDLSPDWVTYALLLRSATVEAHFDAVYRWVQERGLLVNPRLQNALMRQCAVICPERADALFGTLGSSVTQPPAGVFSFYLEAKAANPRRSETHLVDSVFRKAVTSYPLHAPLYTAALQFHKALGNRGAIRRLRALLLQRGPKPTVEFSQKYDAALQGR